jgi:UDP-N-acetylglucosamine 4,6-dehydratase
VIDVTPTPNQTSHTMLTNASLLVTGGTGSFGRAFIQRLLNDCSPREVIVFSRDEF